MLLINIIKIKYKQTIMKSKRSNKQQTIQSEINEQTTKIQNASEIQEEKTLTKKCFITSSPWIRE